MAIKIAWSKPLLLAARKKLEDVDYNAIDDEPGVYFFSRKHGTDYIPFYIGKTENMRARLKQHLATAVILDVLRQIENRNIPDIGQGHRYFHHGYFVPGPGLKVDRCLAIVERHLIRAALEEEYPLLNSHFTNIKTHDIEFSGPKIGHGVFRRNSQVPRA